MTVSAIVPTIGRPASLRRLLLSLASQNRRPDEVIIADGSGAGEIAELAGSEEWRFLGLNICRLEISPPNAVRQRELAIAASSGDLLLLLDDDVELDKDCVSELVAFLDRHPEAVASVADFSNESWSRPTLAWRLYLTWVLRLREGEWQGKVVGPLLRFGYNPAPDKPALMQWLGAGNSLVRRRSFELAGGFSSHFLHRSTMNEDVDLGHKLKQIGDIYLCPAAKLAHHHSTIGRLSPRRSAEDDLFNRFFVLHKTFGQSRLRAFGHIMVYFVIETASNMLGGLIRFEAVPAAQLLAGRAKALLRVATARDV